MRRIKPVTIDKLLTNGSKQLGQLVHQAQRLQHLQQQFVAVLEPELAPHCRALSFEKGLLWVEIDSPIWQWRFNMQRTELIKRLRENGLHGLSSVNCKVSPQIAITASASAASPVISGFIVDRVMSHRSAQDLRELAEQVPEPLKAKLLQLAAREK